MNIIRDSVTTNILNKLNTKLGGINHLVKYPEKMECVNVLNECPIMFFGADVTHPTPGSKVRTFCKNYTMFNELISYYFVLGFKHCCSYRKF